MADTATIPDREAPQPVTVALWLAGQGIHVHPLLPGKKFPPRSCNRCSPGTTAEPNPLYIKHTPEDCRCIAAGRYCHGVRAATTSVARIEAWWTEMPKAGVGIAAGPSNLVIIDVDRHENVPAPTTTTLLPGLVPPVDLDLQTVQDGMDVLGLLCEIRRQPLLGTDPETMTVQTPSGGVQYWYRVADGTQWKPDSKKLGWQIDVKAAWGYGIAPGTWTPKGTYTAVGACRSIAALPPWLAEELDRTGHRRRPAAPRPAPGTWKPRVTDNGNKLVAEAFRKSLENVASAPNGQVSDTLNGVAYYLGRFVGAGYLQQAAVHDAITSAAAHRGVDPSERKAQETIRRGIEAGMRQPREIGARA
ncbi:bifunctional DNA primase/polymerase [[Kitasatospora] papulosa]